MRFSSTIVLSSGVVAVLAAPPRNWGVALFNSYDTIDVFGVLDPLFYLSFQSQINLSLIAETMDPVWVRPYTEAANVHNSTFRFSINPTHTHGTAPEDLEVLLVPGGPAMLFDNQTATVEFVRKVYPNLKYLLTTCTGAGIAAQAGVLDGRRATTNKSAWTRITALGPDVQWVSPARWVTDGNIWTSSGVTSALDMAFTFFYEVFGEAMASRVEGTVEYMRNTDPCDDPFASRFNVPPSGQC
ncbi:ThiJ/PfpI [Stachybotrys elegans]|uniref:ThiJ/PfpI n=1 Tax=Stachybotrys elegans TaxID=80388 RepID=A0A8K0SDR9_9HYPO|nr:ThiJ/PfpI [Stachybotrys elegans]